MTFTLLGQPKVRVSCVPLMKEFPNLMDVPVISSFVQSSLDAALNQYVAPRSITLDLKQMLVGDNFKKDTIHNGVLIIRIRYTRGFKNGDRGKTGFDEVGKLVGLSGGGGADCYITVEWSKFRKPLWLTRIIPSCQTPNWDETTVILVGPDELNAGEKLQLSLWDSDKNSADDHLGSVQVDLMELVKDPARNHGGELHKREDRFQELEG